MERVKLPLPLNEARAKARFRKKSLKLRKRKQTLLYHQVYAQLAARQLLDLVPLPLAGRAAKIERQQRTGVWGKGQMLPVHAHARLA
jgi:hypothetical protein